MLFIQKNCGSIIYLRLFTDQSSPRHHVSTSQQRDEALNWASMSMCNGQLLNFFILICGHIKKISSNIIIALTYGHTLEKKVLTLELSSESTLKNYWNISTGLNATERFFLFLFFFYIHFAFILLFKDSMDTGHYCLGQ